MTRLGAAYTVATGLQFPRTITSSDRFTDKWKELVKPLALDAPVSVPEPPYKRLDLAPTIMGPVHPIAPTPCGHHRLEQAIHFPPPRERLPMRRRKLVPSVHWAPQPRRTGPHTRQPLGDWDGRMRG